MPSIKNVLSSQQGNHSSRGAGSALPSHPTGSSTFSRNANTNGSAGGPKQGTLAAAARCGSNGYTK